jgi:hypothetical protein
MGLTKRRPKFVKPVFLDALDRFDGPPAIGRIAHDRVAEVCEMHANLMRAARLEPRFDE